MQIYRTKVSKLPGTHWHQVSKKAFAIYQTIRRRTKRRPYIRSAYFKKQKIFLQLFWIHLHEKENIRDKTRQVKYFPCAVDLIQHSRYEPITKENPNKKGELLHRFTGRTPDDILFFVQIKEEKRTGEKWLMSVFPEDK